MVPIAVNKTEKLTTRSRTNRQLAWSSRKIASWESGQTGSSPYPFRRRKANGMAFAPRPFMVATINTGIAARLKEIARLLDEQGANQFRVRAYQRAAETLKNLKRPVDKMIKTGGLDALQELPGIGLGLARSIEQFVLTGRLPALERLRGESAPIAALASVPGIGARRGMRTPEKIKGKETLYGI